MREINVVLFLIFIILMSGCAKKYTAIDGKEYSLPPGCIKSIGIPGGCFGKTIIKDLEINPEIQCLEIKPNNCNGGVLVLYNKCAEKILIGNYEIGFNYYRAIELLRDKNNNIFVNETDGNFASYIPSKDDFLSIDGIIGDKKIKISYIKTKPLC